ncbi:MAG TPA: S24 family peptidase [Thermoanaerobaculia bacterium]|nr:S24 family peptidase [Thermoanaerobaculia bacterium]
MLQTPPTQMAEREAAYLRGGMREYWRTTAQHDEAAGAGGITRRESFILWAREYRNQGANAVFVTRGDSMIDAGIFEGDFLFVRKSRNWCIANQHVVVCRLEGTFTVKRLVVRTTPSR